MSGAEFPKMLYGPKGEQKIVKDAEAQAKAGKSWKEDPPADDPDAPVPAVDNMGHAAVAADPVEAPKPRTRTKKAKAAPEAEALADADAAEPKPKRKRAKKLPA